MKKHLLTGLVILMPIALTLMVIVFLFDFFTAPFTSIVTKFFTHLEQIHLLTLPHSLMLFTSRVLALLFLCLFILLLGALARWFLVKNAIALFHNLMSRIPLISTVYKVSKDIISALFSSDGKKAFKYPVMIPFPERPSFAVGFQAGEVADEIKEKIKTPLVSVFTPTAPHPISGFLFLIPEKDVYKLDMSNEEAVKFLVSCGIIHPDSDPKDAEDEIL